MAYILDTRVVGVTFANTGSNRQNRQDIISDLISRGLLVAGQKLDLQRDPDNPYDHNAVSVIGPDGRQIGNLSKENAALLSPKLASGVKYSVRVQSVSGGNGYSYGINIRIEEIESTQTVLNQEVGGGQTVINSDLQVEGHRSFDPQSTMINDDLHESIIMPGTLLCEVYEVVQKMDIVTGEADLYICQFAARKYVAKVYRRKIAIKPEVSERLAQIKSPFVARVFALGEFNGYPVEILPFYMHGSLAGKQFSFEKLKYEIIPSINEGLHVLHENSIIHKDVKPSNIMLNNDGRTASIIDFGISSIRENGSTVVVTKTGLTPEYSAPETFRNLFLSESDYYSLGISIFELYCGHTPYSNMSQEEIEQFISIQKLPLPEKMEQELKDLIDALTYPDITNRRDKSNPNRRWGYEEVSNWCNDIPQPLPGIVANRNINPVRQSNVGNASITFSQSQPNGDMLPYRFAGSVITETSELAEKLNEHWDEGKKHLFRGLLLSHFKKDSNADIISKLMDFEEETDTCDPDILIFKCIYAINPNLKQLIWKGHEWNDLSEFGADILNAVRNNNNSFLQLVDEMISKSVLSQYVLCTAPRAEAQLNVLRSIESQFRTFPNDNNERKIQYYKIGYILADEKTYVSSRETFHSIDDLICYFKNLNLSSDVEYEKACRSLLCTNENELDPQYLCWINAIGLGEKLESSECSDVVLFNSYYAIYPELKSLIWDGKSFSDLHDFGYAYLEATRSDEITFIKYADCILKEGLVSRYYSMKDNSNQEIMQELETFQSVFPLYADNEYGLQKLRFTIAYKLSNIKDFKINEHYFTNAEELVSYLHSLFLEDTTAYDSTCSMLIPSSRRLDPQLECWFSAIKLESVISQWYEGIDTLKEKMPQPKTEDNSITESGDINSVSGNNGANTNDDLHTLMDNQQTTTASIIPPPKSLQLFLDSIKENPSKRDLGFKTIELGIYPQNRSGDDRAPIEWIILSEVGNYALLLSKYTIDHKTYNRQNNNITWAESDLRRWLNSRFIDEALDGGDYIIPISPDNDNEEDSVFLLNFDEIDMLSDMYTIQSTATDYATKRGVKSARDTGFCPYWTRMAEDEMAYVISGGGHNKRKLMTADFVGVRPSIVIDLLKVNPNKGNC